jgi:glycosyltransferase involved in cell wall biosynthesis
VHVTWLGCDHVTRGVDPALFDGPREGTVLTVSRVDRRKNHARMLRAFERLVEAGLAQRWIVAGPDGHGVEGVRRPRSPRRPRARAFERLRDVADHELRDCTPVRHCFLFASLNEGFGPSAARSARVRRAGRRGRQLLDAGGAGRRRAARRRQL